MNILVTGGAGYVGSIITEGLVNKGHRVIVLDNLKQGHREASTAIAPAPRSVLTRIASITSKAEGIIITRMERIIAAAGDSPRSIFKYQNT